MLAEVFETYTYKDYEKWEGDWELIGGIAYAMSPFAIVSHQRVSTRIAYELNKNKKCEECEALVEAEWYIDSENVVRPDVIFTCSDEEEKLTQTPEIIVEVVSKSSAKRDEVVKFDIYEKERVKYYVLAYPEFKKAKIYKLKDGKYQKIGDFYNERFEFDLDCKSAIDFSKVF